MTPERLSEIIAATDGGIRPPEGEPAPRKPTLAEVHAMAASLALLRAAAEAACDAYGKTGGRIIPTMEALAKALETP